MNSEQLQSYTELNQNFNVVQYMHRKATPAIPSEVQRVSYATFEQRGDGSYGRSTFIAQFAPGALFPTHIHDYGEEVYVVEGMLSDEFGDYPKGYYIRQAINSSHTPFSKEGTKLFVKMWQMPLDSTQKVLLNTNATEHNKVTEGVSQTVLYQSAIELVSTYKLSKGTVFHNDQKLDVSEIFVIEGSINVCNVELETQSWIRIPKNMKYDIEATEESLIYVKIGKGIVRGKNWDEIIV